MGLVKEAAKPPYSVPTMTEIEKTPANGYTVVSTFSGCGGSCLGYRMAGYKVKWANEFVPVAADTYRLNHPATQLNTQDIRTVTADGILKAVGMSAGEVDVIEGSPPCASFSTSGKRHDSWGKKKKYSDTAQRTDDLFFEFARIIEGVQPRVFVGENVSGLVQGSAKGYFKEILRRLKGCGYRVTARLLNAEWLGVPQARKRLIFVGVRSDLERDPVHPAPLPYRYCIREAIDVAGVEYWRGKKEAGKKWNPYNKVFNIDREPINTIPAVAEYQFKVTPRSFDDMAIRSEWDKLRPGEHSEKRFNLVKPDISKPCPTILANHGSPSVAGVTHPTERRKFRIDELLRLSSFPDDFQLTGRYEQKWERIGRSVPPVMMYHIAATIRDKILRPLDGHPA